MKRLSPSAIIATFFGIGKIPFMPGTFGSLAAIILVGLLFYQPHFVYINGTKYFEMGAILISPNYIIYILSFAAVISYIVGVWAAEKYSKAIGKDDPSSVVIDEVAGIFTACALVSIGYAALLMIDEKEFILYLIISYYFFPVIFILFRLFDIIKPWHIGRLDRNFSGGFGIMIDDIVAGVYSAIAFYIIFFALKYFGILNSLIKV